MASYHKCLPRLLSRSIGQAGAALGAATGQDLAAVGSSHSLAETIDLLAMQLLGLIGTLRCHNLRHLLSELRSPLEAPLTRHPS